MSRNSLDFAVRPSMKEFLSSPVTFFSCVGFVSSTAQTPNAMTPVSPDAIETAALAAVVTPFLPCSILSPLAPPSTTAGAVRGEKECCRSPRTVSWLRSLSACTHPGGFLWCRGCCDDLLSVPAWARPDTTHCLRPQAFRGSLARAHLSIDRSLAGNQAHLRRLSPG